MTAHSGTEIYTLPLPTPDGEFLARYSLQGLCALDLPRTPAPARPPKSPASLPAGIRAWHAITARALAAALAGQTSPELPPLDLSAGTPFQQQVWQVLRQITLGQTWSYSQVAQAIGQPKAVRAVGGACGANPIPVLVPCHRVLAANHRLGGFSGGLDWKRKLLAREGIRLAT